MTELVPRIRLRAEMVDEVVPAYLKRNGLAIHETLGAAPGRYTITAYPAGLRLCGFNRMTDAEAAFVELEHVTDWTKATFEDSARLKPLVVPILDLHGRARESQEKKP